MNNSQEFKEQLESHGMDILDFESMLYIYNLLTNEDKEGLKKYIGQPYKGYDK